jgi:carbon-monoxide dehydrogenase small subunit
MRQDYHITSSIEKADDPVSTDEVRCESQAQLSLTVNALPVTRTVPVRKSLADFLREDLGLTGTHLGCEHGVCGACTVLLDGRSIRSCLTLAMQVQDCRVTTIEGLSATALGQEVQRSLAAHRALQCGYCTPGFVASIVEMVNDLRKDPGFAAGLEEDEIRSRLSGNICRCTGYEGIVDAAADLCRRLTEPQNS